MKPTDKFNTERLLEIIVLAVIVILMTGVNMYQAFVIDQQHHLIQEMTRNAVCMAAYADEKNANHAFMWE